jgi:hypothetical protein
MRVFLLKSSVILMISFLAAGRCFGSPPLPPRAEETRKELQAIDLKIQKLEAERTLLLGQKQSLDEETFREAVSQCPVRAGVTVNG